jgi:hypothetical protein
LATGEKDEGVRVHGEGDVRAWEGM